MRALLVYNAAAGQRDWRAAVADAAAYLRSVGWEIRLRETERRGDATMFAREAVGEGLDAVLVAGGDGTINETLNGLAHTQVVLGVLPAGTTNVWAQEIGLSVPRV